MRPENYDEREISGNEMPRSIDAFWRGRALHLWNEQQK
jgi:hypothetical protein